MHATSSIDVIPGGINYTELLLKVRRNNFIDNYFTFFVGEGGGGGRKSSFLLPLYESLLNK